MKKAFVFSAVVCLFISSFISAEIIRDGIDIDFVPIGNAGNAADSTGCGAVDYTYKIGTYEITNGQWDQFVSAAGSPTGNPSRAYDESAYWTGTNVPTNKVSWYEAAQFCNYLTSGDKYSGAYNFNPSGDFLGIDRATAISTYGTTYVIPTENEWYKAAYYTGSGYSLYANGTNTAPIAGTDTNYDHAIDQPWEVGVGNGTREQNGTFDMMGNVWEWNETEIYAPTRGCRGGSYNANYDDLWSSLQIGLTSYLDNTDLGFRIASVPEPCSLVLLGLGGLLIRKQK